MKKILITGATGNVGIETIKSLLLLDSTCDVIAGLRDIKQLQNLPGGVAFVNFDFTNPLTFQSAFVGIEVLFILRPPQLSDANKYFKPLIDAAITSEIKHIVFLSVQGVEKSKIIPHHKIEKLIVDSGIPYTFLRPAYFMQNFIGTLNNDLVNKSIIYLPAGDTKFTLVDVSDVGAVAAKVLLNVEAHFKTTYDLTSEEKLTFSQMALKLSIALGKNISYRSPNLISFFFTKKKENVPAMLILIMIMLHYLPRFQNEPITTNCIKKIIGRAPVTFNEFIIKNKSLLTSKS